MPGFFIVPGPSSPRAQPCAGVPHRQELGDFPSLSHPASEGRQGGEAQKEGNVVKMSETWVMEVTLGVQG